MIDRLRESQMVNTFPKETSIDHESTIGKNRVFPMSSLRGRNRLRLDGSQIAIEKVIDDLISRSYATERS